MKRQPTRRHAAWVATLFLLLTHGSVHAQWSARAQWVSDLRFRGVSQSEGHPAWQVSGNADLDGSFYVGGMVYASPQSNASALGAQADAGYAHRIHGGDLTLDAGLVTYRFKPADQDPSYNYTEYFVGLLGTSWASHLYISGNYFGTGAQAGYIEFNASEPVNERMTVHAHAGLLHRAGRTSEWLPTLTRSDVRVGMEIHCRRLDIGLDLVTVVPRRNECEPGADSCHITAVVSVSGEF